MADQEAHKRAAEPVVREIALEHYVPEETPTLYADNLVITRGQGVMTLFFLQSEPPLLTSPDQWLDIKSVRSRCVVRIVVSDAKYPDFATAIESSARSLQRSEDSSAETSR